MDKLKTKNFLMGGDVFGMLRSAAVVAMTASFLLAWGLSHARVIDIEIDALHEKHEKERKDEGDKKCWEKRDKARKEGKEDRVSKKERERAEAYEWKHSS
jgi:hypothetical protein